MKYSKDELIKHRIERAQEAFIDGKILAQNERWRSCANRLYYACFYAISAYLIKMNLESTTHAGLKVIFNRELVKSGRVSREDGKLFNQLFIIRQDADYVDFNDIDESMIAPLIPRIEDLLNEIIEEI